LVRFATDQLLTAIPNAALAYLGRRHTHDRTDHGRLARAIPTEQADQLTVLGSERDPTQDIGQRVIRMQIDDL
jgi:hypothetical protein